MTFFKLWMEFSKVSKSPGKNCHRSVAGRGTAQLKYLKLYGQGWFGVLLDYV